ncbi:fimbrial protein [Halorussus halophilus]|uniref:hypothetical protein n=1 Tax=Halorussus halophilus TaxID=2650975 RepID=UPI001301762D|nr:hypothetical protein [Halorussus halophilus]
MKLTRRQLLTSGATTGAVSLAGCTGGCGGIPFVGANMPHDGVLATETANSVPEEATSIEFSQLPAQEQSLVRTAVEEGVARACMRDDTESTEALSSFADRVTPESSSLRYEGEYYLLYVRIEDMVFAGSADPPEGDANPCC